VSIGIIYSNDWLPWLTQRICDSYWSKTKLAGSGAWWLKAFFFYSLSSCYTSTNAAHTHASREFASQSLQLHSGRLFILISLLAAWPKPPSNTNRVNKLAIKLWNRVLFWCLTRHSWTGKTCGQFMCTKMPSCRYGLLPSHSEIKAAQVYLKS